MFRILLQSQDCRINILGSDLSYFNNKAGNSLILEYYPPYGSPPSNTSFDIVAGGTPITITDCLKGVEYDIFFYVRDGMIDITRQIFRATTSE